MECEWKLETNMHTGQKDIFTKHPKALGKCWNSLNKLFFCLYDVFINLYLSLVGGGENIQNRTIRPHHTLKLYYIDCKGMKIKLV